MATLTAAALEMLLVRLDADPEQAADKYEVLRLKLIRFVSWKGCPESMADALADRVLDRLAVKIGGGADIRNVDAYALEILRFVWLEHLRNAKESTSASGDLPAIAANPDIPLLDDEDRRLECLRGCLDEVVPDAADRALIVGYYDTEHGLKNKEHRKALATRVGVTLTNLKVRACRIRARLEKCITECVAQTGNVTKAL
jgi:DNA-directed RNA polymerase specialized sigma24 family protein